VWSTSTTAFPWLARSSARDVSSARGRLNPGDRTISGRFRPAGRASTTASVRTVVMTEAGMPVMPASSNTAAASAWVMNCFFGPCAEVVG
jgi:hypothetical protein